MAGWVKAAGAIIVTAGLAAGCTKASEVNTPSTTASGAKSSSTTTKPVAHTGATLSLSGESVQLVQVIDPASATDSFMTANPGDRFVATLFKITNTGKQAGEGDANNNATVIGSNDQSYQADFDDVSQCTNFNSGSFQLGPGESATGCVVFQVPTGVSVAKVQWSPGGGLGGDFAEWVNP